ncbi:Homeobox-leucine zipper protein ATHB-13-like protein [Drosera capensis]
MSTCSGIEMAFFPANFILQSSHDHNDHEHDNHHHHQQQQQQQQQQLSSSLSSFLPTCSPHDFHGVSPMLGKRSMSFSAIDMCEESNNNNGRDDGGGGVLDEDLSDDGSQAGVEKKRRLNIEQVKTLERSFEQGNKLEPERKLQLAKALGLRPRQIAIWFQNRRARWKTKQLEKDYVLLKGQFDSLKADNEALLSQNQKLQAEILALKSKEPTKSINLNKETDQGSCSNTSDDDNSSQIKLDITTTRTPTTAESTIVDSYPTSIPLFPPSNSSINGPNHPHHHQTHHVVAQLFPKFDHPVKEESLTNMFCGIEDQSGLWPWLEQNNFS